jgi:phage gpG-like protein
MALEISIESDAASRKLKQIATRAGTILPLYPKVKEYLKTANASNFASNGLLTGGWDPLDPGYSAWKASRFPGAPPLVRSGKLFSSLATLNNSANRAGNTEFEFGTTVEYAKFHQYGTEKMPKRQIVFVPAGFAKWLASNVGTWIVEGRA